MGGGFANKSSVKAVEATVTNSQSGKAARLAALRSAREVMLCWNPGTDEVVLVEWPDEKDLSSHLRCSTFAYDMFVHKISQSELREFVLGQALRLFVAYRCDARAVHRALLGVREYVDCAPRDMPGVADVLDREGES
jgi:hypothetical protein